MKYEKAKDPRHQEPRRVDYLGGNVYGQVTIRKWYCTAPEDNDYVITRAPVLEHGGYREVRVYNWRKIPPDNLESLTFSFDFRDIERRLSEATYRMALFNSALSMPLNLSHMLGPLT